MASLKIGFGFLVLSVVFMPGISRVQAQPIPMRDGNGQTYFLTPNGPMPVRPPANQPRVPRQTVRIPQYFVSQQSGSQGIPKLGVALAPVRQGARIESVQPGSEAAESTNMRAGDVITSINGWRISNVPQLRWVIAHSKFKEANEDGDSEVRYKLHIRYLARRRSDNRAVTTVRKHVTVYLAPTYGGTAGQAQDNSQEMPPGKVEEPVGDPEL
jgi:hypothetical protein